MNGIPVPNHPNKLHVHVVFRGIQPTDEQVQDLHRAIIDYYENIGVFPSNGTNLLTTVGGCCFHKVLDRSYLPADDKPPVYRFYF